MGLRQCANLFPSEETHASSTLFCYYCFYKCESEVKITPKVLCETSSNLFDFNCIMRQLIGGMSTQWSLWFTDFLIHLSACKVVIPDFFGLAKNLAAYLCMLIVLFDGICMWLQMSITLFSIFLGKEKKNLCDSILAAKISHHAHLCWGQLYEFCLSVYLGSNPWIVCTSSNQTLLLPSLSSLASQVKSSHRLHFFILNFTTSLHFLFDIPLFLRRPATLSSCFV